MLYSYDTLLKIYRILLFIVILFYFIDCLLMFFVKKNNILINNIYVQIQQKYSFKVITLFKGACVLVLSYLLLKPPGNIGAVGAIGGIYCIVVLTLLINFITRKWPKK